ncbi:MYSM1 [Branchiostoma lanceolatum]|uniref:Myb-like, SWIRM and MPN domain-containing protein 1 n=2 Tax=Branchiostoma lanceolatum TaxID=7740 RepID=A0A8J9YYL7_BRALA|nr:MYSM1 [Branchiostoma lanceolatum]
MADDEEIDIEGDDDAPLLFDHKDDALALPDLPGYDQNWMFDQGQSWTFDEDMDEQSRSAIEKMLQEEQLYIHGRSHSSYPGEASGSRMKAQKSKPRAAPHLPSHGQPWTEEEKSLFETGLEIYGRSWTSIAQFVQTRTPLQVKNYARHFFKTKEKEDTAEDDGDKTSFANEETNSSAASSTSVTCPGTPKRKRPQETKCATPKTEQTPKKVKVVRKLEETLIQCDPVLQQEGKVQELSTTAIPDKYGHMQVVQKVEEGEDEEVDVEGEESGEEAVMELRSTCGLTPAVATSDHNSFEEPTLEGTETEHHPALDAISQHDSETSKQETSEEGNPYPMDGHFLPVFPWQPDDTQNRVIVERIEGTVGLSSVRGDKEVRPVPSVEQNTYVPHPDMFQAQTTLLDFEKPPGYEEGFQETAERESKVTDTQAKASESETEVTERQTESPVNTAHVQTFRDAFMEGIENLSESVSSSEADLKTTIQDVVDQGNIYKTQEAISENEIETADNGNVKQQNTPTSAVEFSAERLQSLAAPSESVSVDNTNTATASSSTVKTCSSYTLDIPEGKAKPDLAGAEKWSCEEGMSSHADSLTFSDSDSGKETRDLLRCGTEFQGHSEDETSDTGQAEEAFFPFKKPTEEVVLDRSVVTEEEKEVNKEFFDGRQTKTPERYLKIRNHLLDCWERSKPDYLRKTVARAGLRNCGDVNCIGRIHGYLERIGAINFGCEEANRGEFPVAKVGVKRNPQGQDDQLARQAARLESMRPRRQKLVRTAYGDWTDGTEREGLTIEHVTSDELEKQDGEVPQIRPSRSRAPRTNFNSFSYDPFKLVPCKRFSEESPAPFSVKIHATALVTIDMHAHISTAEVIGLLGGVFHRDPGALEVASAEPCNSLSTGMQCEMDPVSQTQASEALSQAGYAVVGWYHSHPTFAPNPSVRDIETQTKFQEWFAQGGSPFIGIIVNPYSSTRISPLSRVTCLTISSEWEHIRKYNIPFQFDFVVDSAAVRPAEVIDKAKRLAELHGNSPQRVKLLNRYAGHTDTTYMDKMLYSLSGHLCRGNADSDADGNGESLTLLTDIRDIFANSWTSSLGTTPRSSMASL